MEASPAFHRGRIADIAARRIFPGTVEVRDGRIAAVTEDASADEPGFICPGFVDAHVHIESSMLTPPEFARIAVVHGTTGTVSDPHEIANVLGVEGVRYMQKLAAETPCKIHFGIPSCVPATAFETAGAALGPDAVEELCRDPSLLYLSEMMNFPGVIHRDPEVMAKLEIAKRHGKRIDGHAPGLRGENLRAYAAAGIETDHECFRIDEAREKLSLGMKILIREGSAARAWLAADNRSCRNSARPTRTISARPRSGRTTSPCLRAQATCASSRSKTASSSPDPERRAPSCGEAWPWPTRRATCSKSRW